MSTPAHRDLPALPLARGVAHGLEGARPGQTWIVDGTGTVLTPRSIGWLLVSLRTVLVPSACGAIILALTEILGPPFGPWLAWVAPIGVALWAWPRLQLNRALRLVNAGELVTSVALARRVATGRFVDKEIRGNAWLVVGSAMSLRGELEAALATTQRAVAMLGRPRSGQFRGVAAVGRINEIQLLAVTGNLAAAQDRLAELERDGLPDGDLVHLLHIETMLVLAFEAGDHTALPAELEPWSRLVLATNRFGAALVLLAWAHEQRGETEMAATLIDVATDRLPECRIEAAHPRLAAWLATRGA